MSTPVPFDPTTFQFQANFGGVKPSAGGGKLPSNYYRGVVLECTGQMSKNGKPMYVFKLSVKDPEHSGFDGVNRTARVMVPQDTSKLGYMRAALDSCGFPAGTLDQAGAITVAPAIFNGRACTFFYEAGDEAAGTSEECNLLDPVTWQTRKAAFLAGGGAPAAGGGQANPFGGQQAANPFGSAQGQQGAAQQAANPFGGQQAAFAGQTQQAAPTGNPFGQQPATGFGGQQPFGGGGAQPPQTPQDLMVLLQQQK